MKYYVFITMTICDIGGSLQYVYNKTNFLEKQGYQVLVYSAIKHKILINGLKKFDKYIIPALMYSPDIYRKKQVKSITNKIVKQINLSSGDTCIIETNGIDEAKWGELLAEELKCKHFAFDLEEVHNYSDEERNFYKFKLARNELAGIVNQSVSRMIKENIQPTDNTVFKAYCTNVVDECEDLFSEKLDKKAFTFGSIGRLEKPCVNPMLEELITYAKNNSDKKFNLVLIGGTNEKQVLNKIYLLLESVKNINLIITDLIYPIPRNLINNIDIFISTAGSANVSYLEGKPTIRINPISGKPLGIIGYNYQKGELYTELKNTSIIEQVELITSGNITIKYEENPYKQYIKDMQMEFDRQLAIESKYNKKEYYEVLNISKINSTKYKIYKVLGKTLGVNCMPNFVELCRKIIN